MGSLAVRQSVAWDACLLMQEVCLPGDQRITDSGDRYLWLAKRDGKPCGFLILQDIGDDAVYVELVGVLPEATGQGLQRKLMRVALRWARKAGAKLAISYTAHWNHASSNNFVADGWRLYTPEYRWGWADGLYWRKSL